MSAAHTQAYQQDERYRLAMENYVAGQWSDADGAFTALDAAYPDVAAIKLMRGNIAYSLGQLEAAVRHYDAAIALNEQFGVAYYKLGVCLYRMGQLGRALAAFEQAQDLGNESHAMATYFVGMINVFTGNDAVATEAFARFHEQSPDSRIADFYLAQLHIKRKRFAEAETLLKGLAEVAPNFAEVHYMLGTVEYGLHKNTDAIKSFTRALELNPGDERSKTKLTLLTDVQWP